MSQEIERERAAYDRRQRAWTFFVLGALVLVLGWGMAAEGMVVGWALFVGGLASATYGVVLFQKPRP